MRIKKLKKRLNKDQLAKRQEKINRRKLEIRIEKPNTFFKDYIEAMYGNTSKANRLFYKLIASND